MREADSKKPKFIKPPNYLKQKVGAGGINETLLEKGQEAIAANEFDFAPYAQTFLTELARFRTEAQQTIGDDRAFEDVKERMILPVMQLKAAGGMFRYQLVSDVADIALQFLEAVDNANEDTFDVIKAHENTLNVIISKKLQGDGGKAGYALIKELDGACQRYFNKHGKKDTFKL